jgi:glycosyltransferase involved in cell wall biosynthesis
LSRKAPNPTDFRPTVSFITWGAVEPFHRSAQWIGSGFAEIGIPFDAAYLRPSKDVAFHEGWREVGLGTARARWAIPQMTRYLRWARPELTLVRPANIAPFALAAGRLAGCRVVPWEVTFVDWDLSPDRRRHTALALLPWLQKLTYRWPAEVAVVSDDVGTALRRRLGKTLADKGLIRLAPPIDPEWVRSRANPAVAPARALRLSGLGRLVRQKGWDVLLEALRTAPAQIDWELVVMGDGPLHGELERLAVDLGLASRVRFLGHVENPYPILAGSDALVHPTRWEGFGLAVLEGLALGLPVVATTCPGGPKEILEGRGGGILVPPDDAGALADALLRIMTDEQLRQELRRQALRRVEDFAPSLFAKRVMESLL